MKRLVFAILALVVTFAVSAQSENSIIIDQSSFRAVQTDALTGVAIDPISVDSSRRPCARIKVRLNRMTREDINEIEVKIVTNNELRKCRTMDYDNGLIIEMTAKPETRFYFQHPRLGYSNEVLVALEANKEYRLDSYLNQLLSISIMSDAIGADVYIDEMYKGQIRSNGSLVVHNISASKHTIRLENEGKTISQDIFVDSENIGFVISSSRNVISNIIQNTQCADKSYKVGEYYDKNGKKGIVFYVTPDGKHGKIVSEKYTYCEWSIDVAKIKKPIGASDIYDGANNMEMIKQIPDWKIKYPAFRWCADLGKDWYLPAIEELKQIFYCEAMLGEIRSYWHFSSTETGKSTAEIAHPKYPNRTGNGCKDNYNYYIRAVAKF